MMIYVLVPDTASVFANRTSIALLLLILGVLWLAILIRNIAVFKYRDNLLNRVYDASIVDIENGLNWKWRFDRLGEIGYLKMLFEFWRPVDSFYKDLSFTDPNCTPDSN